MSNNETSKERKKRFKKMSSQERKSLIRKKLKNQGLIEGSGVPGKSLSSYNRDEIWDLIQATSCLDQMKLTKPKKGFLCKKNKYLISSILVFITFTGVMTIFYKQYPNDELRRELSVEGMFLD